MSVNQFKITELEKAIDLNRGLYWDDGDCVSDSVYDQWLVDLAVLDPTNYRLSSIEHNKTSSLTIKHAVPMLSLDKVYSKEEVSAWMTKTGRGPDEEFVISPKYDGIAAKNYGEAKILATRGDGENGENISGHLPLIVDRLGQPLDPNADFMGEIILTDKNFAECTLTRKDGRPFRNPRNAVGGICNPQRTDIDHMLGKVQLVMVGYDQDGIVMTQEGIEKNWDSTMENFLSMGYPLDGMVIALRDKKYYDSLGVTSHHPRGSMVFKFKDEEVVTTLIGAKLQSGKKQLTPVAKIAPVEIGGVTIDSPTLHNGKTFLDFNLHYGDKITIVRRGGVIPYIAKVERTKDSIDKVKLDECPSCGKDVEYREPHFYCSDDQCAGNFEYGLTVAAKTLGIDNLGQSTVAKLIEDLDWKLISISGFFLVSVEDLLDIEGFGKKSADRLISNIDKVRSNLEDWRLLAALNIPNIGESIAKDLTLVHTISELREKTEEELQLLDSIGPGRATNLYNGLITHGTTIDEMDEMCFVVQSKGKIIKQDADTTVCFSGTFSMTKAELQTLAEAHGWTVAKTVTKNLGLLVSAGTSSKTTKADKYGVKVVTEDEFSTLLTGAP